MAKAKRARIQDVAKHAGVSNMTVSRVLNQDTKVSDSKRALVMEAVKALNYRPNVAARRLASHKSFFLGLLYVDMDTSYVSKFLLRALKSCRASGHHLIVDEIDDDLKRSVASVKELIEVTQVDGMVLLPPVSDMPEVLKCLQDANVPFVRIAPDTQLGISPYICIDDYKAGFDITELMIKQGHRKIAHIIGNPNQGSSRLRYQGYLDALRAHQITSPPQFIEQGYFSYQSGLTSAHKLLALDEKPTAIFASNDEMAAAAITASHVKQLKVPEDLSVAGFDDGHIANIVSPHLTTIRQPITEMAELAIDILVSERFKDSSKTNISEFRHILDFEIIERDSTCALPK